MKVETTELENRILKVVIDATPEETETSRRMAAQNLGKKVRVPGFRPGKAPYPILLKHLDPVVLQEETIQVFLDRAYPQVLDQENINPYSQGKLVSIRNLDPLSLEIHIPLRPLVELGDYRSVRVPYEPPLVSEEEVDKALNRIRQLNALLEPVNRSVQEEDVVYIDLVGYRMENGETTDQIVVEKQDLPIEILSPDKNSWEYPFEGFSRELIGKQAGDQLSVQYHYPEDALSKSLKGMTVHFEAKIKEVKTKILPELNDEFAQSLGDYSSLEELRKSIRSMLEEESLAKYLQEYDEKILREIIHSSKIEYPLELAENERQAYLKELKTLLSQYLMDIDLYNKIRGVSQEQFEEEVNQAVEDRLRSSLVLFEISKKENIKINPDRVRENTQQMMQDLLEETNRTRVPNQTLQTIAYRLAEHSIIDQVLMDTMERLRQIAKGEEIVSEESAQESPSADGVENQFQAESRGDSQSQENLSETTESVSVTQNEETTINSVNADE
ncbi:MAG: trigger factor [Anaerolineae bacterium]|nr:MAG: trigger factor [Anaerolineae bacterium]